MTGRHGGVVVANPGGVSWMIQSAATFARHGELAGYYSPAAISQPALEALERRLPRRLAGPIGSQLRLRAVPAVVPADRIMRAGTPTEVAYVMARRQGLPMRVVALLTHRQAVAFDRAVARSLHAGLDAVIGYHGTSMQTFQVAARRGVVRILDYPIAHYETTESLLSEEVRRVPAYAGTMQGNSFVEWKRRRYAEEIATADRIVMLSTYQQRTFEAAGIDPARLFIAPLCVDSDLFSPAPEPPDGTFRVIFCGQITQRKGISYLVEGFLRAELENAELVFVGMPIGRGHPWLEVPRVKHLGAVSRYELPAIMRTGHVSVLPSLIEGFGVTALEGMACGLPAIVSEHTLGHDVVEDDVDGWVVPVRDAEAIAARLRQLYEDRELQRRMSRAARAKAKQFPWPRYGEALRAGIAPLLRDR
jgi:starch synthase